MTINLHEIFSRCSWRNANSKYMDKIWLQTTSKEYLTNSHILSIYFELAFLQLHLVKISCKLIIIWVNCERNKKGARFFETQCILSVIKDAHWWPAFECIRWTVILVNCVQIMFLELQYIVGFMTGVNAIKTLNIPWTDNSHYFMHQLCLNFTIHYH